MKLKVGRRCEMRVHTQALNECSGAGNQIEPSTEHARQGSVFLDLVSARVCESESGHIPAEKFCHPAIPVFFLSLQSFLRVHAEHKT